MIVSKLQAFRALSMLVEQLSEENNSENLGVLAVEMQPPAGPSHSNDPALFQVWERLWGEGEKEPSEAAEIAQAFVAGEAEWGYDDDGPNVLHQSLSVAQVDDNSSQFKRWFGYLEQSKGDDAR